MGSAGTALAVEEIAQLLREVEASAKSEVIEHMEAAHVIDVPMRKAAGGAGCEYVMASGELCGREAESEDRLCQVHADWMRLGIAQWGVPFPEDATSLQQFLGAVMDRLVNGKVRVGTEKAIADVCKVIARNVRGVEMERRAR